MKKESGFIEYNAVLLLFFISAVISGLVLYAASAIKYSQTDNNDFENKLAADKLLDEIIGKIQPLRLYQYDNKENDLIISLSLEYQNYNLKITDVSSGYHLDFLSDDIITDSNITGLLFKDNTGTAFTTWRNENGLSVTKEPWREFLKEEIWESCVSYGWLHKSDTESFAFKSISASFVQTDPEKLFPVVNDFPRMNVNMLNPDILRPLVTRNIFGIERVNERTDLLINRLKSGSIMQAEISSILGIPMTHPLMSYLGTKTSFWQISFKMPSNLEVEAIIAAIPKKDGDVQEIEVYRLIDRSFL